MRLARRPGLGATVKCLQVRARGETGDVVRRTAKRRARALERGFTLIELMVVVVLVAILALLATPLMRTSRDDRLAFDAARRIEQLWTRAQVRAAGHGAHLFVAQASGTPSRGRFLLFESFDNTAAPLGPAPRQGCKGVGQWAAIATWTPGSVSGFIKFVDGFDQNTAGANADADIRAAFTVNGAPTPAFVMCVSGPNVWVGTGATAVAAAGDMADQVLPFSATAQIAVTRNVGATPVGLTRFVRKTGNATALVFSR